jgi:hypothetical protein
VDKGATIGFLMTMESGEGARRGHVGGEGRGRHPHLRSTVGQARWYVGWAPGSCGRGKGGGTASATCSDIYGCSIFPVLGYPLVIGYYD